jgi:hypothetical protein
MWRDDLDTAFRHLDLYDRFGCPAATSRRPFRCLTRFGGQIDPRCRKPERRVHACWINPAAQPQARRGAHRPPHRRHAAPAPAAPPRRRPPAAPAQIICRHRNDAEISRIDCRALKTPRRHTSC